jgi:hypothetical protein
VRWDGLFWARDDLYDFICTTTDPQHEQRINQNNPNCSGLHALYNICQQYKESAVTTLQRGLAALRTLPQQTTATTAPPTLTQINSLVSSQHRHFDSKAHA